jgi:hypothetical protein
MKLCRAGVMVDHADAKDQVEKLGDLAIKQGLLHSICGD